MWCYECSSLWTRTACASSMLLIYSSAPTHRMRYHYRVTNSRALGERTHRIDNILLMFACCSFHAWSEDMSCTNISVLEDLTCFVISMPYLASRWQMRRTEGTRWTYRLYMSSRPYWLYSTTVCHLVWHMTWRDMTTWHVWHVWQVWQVWQVWHICHRSYPWQKIKSDYLEQYFSVILVSSGHRYCHHR